MAKVYLRADENEAGVTVEEIEPRHTEAPELSVRFIVTGEAEPGVIQGAPFIKAAAMLTDAEARAVVEGLLRRMWERDGWGLTNAWYQRALENWLKSKDMGRQGEGR